MNLRLILLSTLLVGTALAAPLPFPRPIKKKAVLPLPDALQGLWEVKTRTGANGLNMGISVSQKFVRIEGTNWTYLRADKTTAGTQCTMTLNPNLKPAHLDLGFPTAINGAGIAAGRIMIAGPYMTGIVSVEGDRMKFCYALRSDRPTSFTPTNPREYLFTLERVEEKPAKDSRKR